MTDLRVAAAAGPTTASTAAFHLLTIGTGAAIGVECCACGEEWTLTLAAVSEAMRHTCRLTHRCIDHCPKCNTGTRRK